MLSLLEKYKNGPNTSQITGKSYVDTFQHSSRVKILPSSQAQLSNSYGEEIGTVIIKETSIITEADTYSRITDFGMSHTQV